MATLKAQDFELNFSYYNINSCNEIEYSFSIMLNGKPFFNPAIISKTAYSVKNRKFILSDCWAGEDWLYNFFTNILTTKKGGSYRTTEPPEWCFEAITWEDIRVEKEKSWEIKTLKLTNENKEVIDAPYSSLMELFIPFLENNIDLKIEFPHEVFDTKAYTSFSLSLQTNFLELQSFFEIFDEEMKLFYNFFSDRIQYLGNGKYKENEDFIYTDGTLDKDIYLVQKCAEWNNQINKPEHEIILQLLLRDIRIRNYNIVGTARYIIKSSVSKNLAYEIFALAEIEMHNAKDKETIKKIKAIKTVIAIVFPDALSTTQLSDALSKAKRENIPEELFNKNKALYLQYLGV